MTCRSGSCGVPGRSSRVVLLLAAVCLPAVIAAQSLPFRTYASDDGLSQSVVLCLAQDRLGYLWLGTAHGLSRFDGLVFTSFSERDGLPHNVMRAVLVDGAGDVWVGTDAGLVEWRDGKWEAAVPELARHPIRCLAKGRDGVLWVGTHDAGVARVENGHAKFISTADGLAGDLVRAVLVAADGSVWVGTYGSGVSHLQADGSIVSFSARDGLADGFVRALAEGNGGQVLVGTNSGVFAWTGSGFTRFAPDPVLDQVTVTALLLDRRGRLWIGTRERGAFRWDGARLDEVRAEHGLADNSIDSLLEDREGNLWFGTYGAGVSRLCTESFHNYGVRDGLPQGGVTSFVERGDELWLGTHGGGISRRKDGRWTRFTTREGLPHDKVLAAAVDSSGALWVGTLQGAARFDGERFVPFTTAQGIAHEVVYAIYADPEGGVWFGTFSGLVELSNGTVRTYTVRDGLPGARVNHIIPSRQGGLWLATEGGLARFRDGRFVCYRKRDGLADDFVNWVHERPNGEVWVATSGGVSRLRDGAFTTFTTADGLSHDLCSVIVEDDAGRLWIGTARGVNVFDGSRFTAFTTADGLPSGEVLPGAGMKGRDGRLWFGTGRGATVFEADAASPHVPPPLVHVSRLEVEDEERPLTARLRVPYDENRLRFEFVGVSLAYPEHVTYEYRLEGLEQRWQRTQGRSAVYPAVPPGRYTFAVRARHVTGAWSDPPALVAVEVVPPFWGRWWFRLLAVVALGVAGLVVHRARTRTLRARQERLEALVRERTAEVRRERQQVAEKSEQLQIVNAIVKQINTELELTAVLQSILEGVSFFVGVDAALALVLDEAAGVYRVEARYGWPGQSNPRPGLPRELVERELLARGRQIAPGITVGAEAAMALREGLGASPPSVLVMAIAVEGRPVGCLVFDAPEDVARDPEALSNLKGHVTSAFAKGRMMKELKALNATKDEFLGIAAHDLRSPLGSIISTTDLLLRFVAEERRDAGLWRRFLGGVHRTADQMLALVNDLLDVTSIETGRVRLELTRQSIGEILSEREALLGNTASAKGIELVVDRRLSEVEVLADPLRVAEVLDNLISNALKYTQPGGRVSIACEVLQTELVTHVTDTGQGLEPAELAAVFTGRKLSARPTAGEPSTGFGLVIARKLVELHGGRIWAVSQKGEGSTFSFSLPLAPMA